MLVGHATKQTKHNILCNFENWHFNFRTKFQCHSLLWTVCVMQFGYCRISVFWLC